MSPDSFTTDFSAMQNVLAGYQGGRVYKPIYVEAQAAAALALFLRAGQDPPDDLVNGSVTDPGQRQGRAVGVADADVGERPTT